jgi:Ni/Fe-hydrogenase subunit HybB-like protein
MFIVLSFGWGLAVFLLVQAAMMRWNGQAMPGDVQRRLNRLLGVFVAAALYLVAVYHGTNLYFARQHAFEAFILLGQNGGDLFAGLLWVGFVGVGSVLPMVMLFSGRFANPRWTLVAAALVVLGAFAFLYVFIVGGQAFPLEIFPGWQATSSFGDGAVTHYVPRLPEWLLGLGGLGAAFVLTTIGVRVLDVLPRDENLKA